ncbi:hypothetical protein TNCV_552461 [Trichonephila clavipes]|nr:hypothetical protein TNCV_552461 [Trichonephila clavipes]
MTRSSAPYLETTMLLVLLAWLVGGGVASLRKDSIGGRNLEDFGVKYRLLEYRQQQWLVAISEKALSIGYPEVEVIRTKEEKKTLAWWVQR